MAWIRIRKGIDSSGSIEFVDKSLVTTSHPSGSSGSASTSTEIILPANSTYVLSCVLTQSSAQWSTVNTSLNTGSWTYSSSPIIDTQLFTNSSTRGSNPDTYHGGTDRIYTEQRLVKVGNSAITASHNGTSNGWGGNLLIEVAAIKIGKKSAEFTAKNIGVNGFSGAGTGSASASTNVVLPANGIYIVSCIISQTSSNTYGGNSGLGTGAWSFSSTPISQTQLFTDSGSRVHAGTLRSYTEQILVEVGDSPITVSRNGSCSGYGGNIIVEVASVKIT